jgi:putative PIN family toxin of toxin-antitoxin system
MPGAQRIVLDTNLVISGLLFPCTPPSKALLKAQTSQILGSDATLLEFVEVMGRPRFDRYIEPAIRKALAAEYVNACEKIHTTSTIRECRDPRDDMILELAVDGRADVILIGDLDLLELHPFRGVAILTPQAYLDLK